MDAQLRLLIHHPLGDRPAANSSACGDLSDRSNFLYLIYMNYLMYMNLHERMAHSAEALLSGKTLRGCIG